ncbi:3-oxoacyl-(acyl-carrier-protein) reductase FabG [Agrobacterium genomosp. 2 str. CFBP 5494]|nr:NAD(P)-dependent oxidoreductase [Rhizobium sp. P007]CUX04012.1 3-oxoacyl-(acyl-carrier-protein) reductase FabG [Agrobacterium genomosp. 2 str. CFBP 5494]
MQRDMTGRVALVTGAAHGIGLAIADRLAGRGAHVVIWDIDRDAGERTVRDLAKRDDAATFMNVDLADPTHVLQMACETVTRFSGIDILVNNAGIVSTGPVEDIELAEFQRLIAIDLTAVFLLTKSFLPHMAASHWGRIVNIASVAGQQGGGLLGNSCYAAAKGAVIAFSKGIAREAGPFNVTCNTICPGLTDTDLTSSLTDKQREDIVAAIPVGRTGRPDDIAEATAFLVSPAAGFITGVTLNVDGGFMRY